MYSQINTCEHACRHIYTYREAYMYIHRDMYAHVHVYMHTHSHVHTYTDIHTLLVTVPQKNPVPRFLSESNNLDGTSTP